MCETHPTGPTLADLLVALPQVGMVTWIGLRPARRAQMRVVEQVEALPGQGLVGDRFRGRAASKRQVTMIQAEHLAAVAGMLGRSDPLDPCLTRRNIVVGGINLLALKDRQFRVGEVLLAYSGQAHPCSRMEEALGPGGFNAMRGHGGITAQVVEGGIIRLGDEVRAVVSSQ